MVLITKWCRFGAVALTMAAVMVVGEVPVWAANWVQETDAGPARSQPAHDPGPPVAPLATLAPGDSVVVDRPSPEGFYVTLAESGHAPTVLAALRVDGMETAMWTGTTCRTGSGRFVAAAFGPTEMIDDERASARGAFGAVIDVSTREVRLLHERVALKYHSPGCGPDNEMVFTRYDDAGGTELLTVASQGEIAHRHTRSRHLVAPAPVGDVVFAAGDRTIVRIEDDDAGRDEAMVTAGTPFDLLAREGGDVDFLEASRETDRVDVVRAERGTARRLGGSLLGALDLVRRRGGVTRALATAPAQIADMEVKQVARIPAAVSADAGVPVDAQVRESASREPALVLSTLDATGTVSSQVSVADARSGREAVARLAAPVGSDLRVCAVARNDPNIQVMQPSARQVEWAVNAAVNNRLSIVRPTDWHNNGLGTYSPGSMFPPLPGGVRVPAQVVLAVLAQESNLQQAARGALPGVPANPLIGNYYGAVYDESGRLVGSNFAKADCGYGIGQITDGMRTDEAVPFTIEQKKAIATDYAANIAAAVRVLQQKWNEAASQGLKVNTGDPSLVENWYFALWGYNSGIYPPPGAPYGVGWTNNPANSDWKPDRRPFLRESYEDAARPYFWPYQEKVLGWAETGQFQGGELAYAPTTRLSLPLQGSFVDRFKFCVPTVNECNPGHEPGRPANYGWSRTNPVDDLWYCTRGDRKCYWRGSVSWGSSVGTEVARYVGEPEPTVTNPHPPSCRANDSSPPPGESTGALLAGAVIVDDVPDMANIVGCAPIASAGNFSLTFGVAANGSPLGEIDTHQIGAGYGGHFWYAHATDRNRYENLTKGTWTPPLETQGWTRVIAHIPDHGADTFQAEYRVFNGIKTDGYLRTVNQRLNRNSWVDLGIFDLRAGSSRVELVNSTWSDHLAADPVDVAWDAMAFVPTPRPKLSMVSLGDSFSAGEGIEPYYPESDIGAQTPNRVNACHRSSGAYPLKVYEQLRAQWGTPSTFHFAACSGAVIDSVNGNKTEWGEVPQLRQGWIDENTNLVTVSISGNDALFAQVINGCIRTLTPCTDPNYHLTLADGTVESEPLIVAEPKRIDNQLPRLVAVLREIRRLAPKAYIMLVGYPQLIFNDRSEYVCYEIPFVNWADSMADRLDWVMAEAVRQVNADTPVGQPVRYFFTDPRASFEGHEACPHGQEEWIHHIILRSESGSGLSVPGSGSFHPKIAGHDAYARDLLSVLPDTPPSTK